MYHGNAATGDSGCMFLSQWLLYGCKEMLGCMSPLGLGRSHHKFAFQSLKVRCRISVCPFLVKMGRVTTENTSDDRVLLPDSSTRVLFQTVCKIRLLGI